MKPAASNAQRAVEAPQQAALHQAQARTRVRRALRHGLAAFACAVAASGAGAAGIDGLWQQFDDEGRLNSLVRIETVGGEVQATIVKGYPVAGRPRDPDERCTRCTGALQNQPLVGMRFLWGLKGSEPAWDGGQIVDPADGRSYRAKATLSADGSRLTVRGYLGVAMFGRNQVWQRHTGAAE